MKIFTKITSVMLLVILVFGVCITSASALIYGDGKFEYELDFSTKTARVINFIAADTSIDVPSEYNGYTVTEIAERAFANNTNLKSVNLPDTIKKIDTSAFIGMTALTDFTIPETVTELGESVFSSCTSLQSVTVNASVDTIPKSFFYGCTSLSEVNLNSEIVNYSTSAFYGCTSLKSFPQIEYAESIGEMAFYRTGLTSVTISDKITNLPRYSFAGCSDLTSVVIPDSVTSIYSNAFKNDSNLTIFCYDGSFAQTYAEENGIKCVIISKYEIGDVDMDGEVTISDVTLIQKNLVDIESLTEEAEHLADVDKNGTVNIDDATLIQKFLAEIITSFE